MGRLNSEQIKNILIAKGYTAVDISSYENKNSNIIVSCPNGHIITASLEAIERPNFKCPKCIGEQFESSAANGVVPEKCGYRIVAFDQSSNNIGVSIYDNGRLVYYDWYVLQGELDIRLKKWYDLVYSTACKLWQADYIMFEDIQYQQQAGVLTFKTLAMVLGVGIAAATAAEVEHDKVLNKTWQSEFNIAGSNRVAQKRNVVERVKEYFNIDVTDDVGDAILIGRYAVDTLYERWTNKIF